MFLVENMPPKESGIELGGNKIGGEKCTTMRRRCERYCGSFPSYRPCGVRKNSAYIYSGHMYMVEVFLA